jgi:hypothetical protein
MRINRRLNSLFAVLLTVAIVSNIASRAEDGPDFLVLDPRGE